ncbi:exodeoxyribonuclease VII large subunit [Helicobacter cholecystus]|uniref:Exodeoxyribonuclease 7 large subunit n=1 Tax=Helicobacter cholecystus TaxID=45498 RepID=A0A3D8IW57_9HELI|nr:exodeoxyribonuclease VII large subunit [Helicobacter cholecystus]RDU69462.1 exodeoxyribonuclease VII large subunit [Helicobacter cholecystus]VEJ24013.1 exodeoxyribonuclease VII large subunit [Helicobacter cholecystus]
MQKALSVNELNLQIKEILEQTFLSVCVEGEISNLTIHTSGHIYFTLKDSQSCIKCVLFRGNAQYLDFKPQNGQKIIALGGISVYPPRGDYQILCKKLISHAMGDLFQAYEILKKKLEAKGYFENKKPLPLFPKKVALLTSSTGAALQDMLRVALKRWNLVEFKILNTLVQGEGAKESIAQNIAYADTLGMDIIVLARGGGSKEDLWAFNEEIVADAIFQAKTPIVSAIGHESDVLISDFVADRRAPTPSACMEMILPDRIDWLYRLNEMQESLSYLFSHLLKHKSQTLLTLKEKYTLASPAQKLLLQERQIQNLKEMLKFKMQSLLEYKSSLLCFPGSLLTLNPLLPFERRLQELQNIYKLQSPKTQKGYAQITKNQEILELEDLSEGEVFELTNSKTSLFAQVLPKV